MPIFKYIVANKEGKKLSGTVEAPDQITAKTELNNLGFSIFSIEETQEQAKFQTSMAKFVFEAIDKNGKLVSGTIPSKTKEEAFEKLETEYLLNVSAIWEEGASLEQIAQAKQKGTAEMQARLEKSKKTDVEATLNETLEEKKHEQFVRTKIELVLKEVNQLLQNFDKELDPNQKAEIAKKIDKLLRIKHSTNLDYIIETANELLEFIQAQEKLLKEKGHQGKQLELKLKTKKLLNELNKKEGKKTISTDIVSKIENWEIKYSQTEKHSKITNFINNILLKIKKILEKDPQILEFKEKIKSLNRQIFELLQLYFKEPTPEYKTKVKQSIKAVWQMRKKTKAELKEFKKSQKQKGKKLEIEENIMTSFFHELNSFTGWVLGFYIIYYFVSLYLTTKDFGLSQIPKGFFVYESHLFKYILVILFLMHTCTALKVNFFKKSFIADIVLIPIFIFGTIVTLLNF